MEVQTAGRSRRVADDGRHFADRDVRSAGIVVGIVNGVPVMVFSVAQQPSRTTYASSRTLVTAWCRWVATAASKVIASRIAPGGSNLYLESGGQAGKRCVHLYADGPQQAGARRPGRVGRQGDRRWRR